MLRPLLRVFWYLLAGFVVAAALGLSVARLALPMLEARAGQLETMLQELSGEDVRVGHLEVDWRGFGPELRVYDFALRDRESTEELLTARELRVDFDLWRSLWAWRPVPGRLVLLGSEIRLSRGRDGRLAVEGIHMRRAENRAWPLVLSQPHVELRDIRMHWHDAQGQIRDLVLDDVDLRMRNRGGRHQLQVNLQLPPEYGGTLQVAADLWGEAQAPSAWSGAVYVGFDRAPIAKWLTRPAAADWRLDGVAGAELWMQIRDGAAHAVRGSLNLDRFRVAQGAGAGPRPSAQAAAEAAAVEAAPTDGLLFDAERLTTQFDWQRNERGWALNLDRLQVRQAGTDWPATGATVVFEEAVEQAERVQAAIDYLRLEAVLPLLLRFTALDEPHRALLLQLQPGGDLRDLQVSLSRREGRIHDLAYRLHFADVHNTPVEKLPGSARLSGRLAGDARRGVLELDSRDLQLLLPALFREPLVLSELSGRVDWQRRSDRLRVESAALTAVNADLRTQTRLRLDIPTDGSRPLLDLQTAFAEGRVESAHKYLPVGIMPPRTVTWLDRALVSGRISSGAALFQGRLGDFPFDHADGRLEVRAAVSDAVLDYQAGWHRIEGLEAELAFVNRGMHIRGVTGRVLDSEIRDVDVRIADLAHARLEIDGHARGPLADMLRVVQDSPLAKDANEGFTERLGEVQAQGDARLQLGLRIPLGKPEPATVDGRVQLAGNRLALAEWDVALDALTGELHFSQQGVDGGELQGNLFDTPVRIAVDLVKRGGQELSRVRATGRLPLLERLQGADGFFAQRLSGGSDWVASLYLPRKAGSAAGTSLELQSDLRGVGVDLPPPFGKSADSPREFRLSAAIQARRLGAMTLHYGEHSAAFALERRADKLQLARAELRLGGADARLPKGPGMRVRGRLSQFRWDDWRALSATIEPSGGAPAAGLPDAGLAGAGLNLIDVEVGELQAFGRGFQQLQIRAKRSDERWDVQLEGPDIQGTLMVPANSSAPLQMRFAQLRIPPAKEDDAGSRVDPAKLPALDLDALKLQFGNLDLGHVNLQTHPLTAGLSVDALQIEADWARIAATGEWTRQAQQDASRFHIQMRGGELGKLLSAFGYAGNVSGGETRGEIDANWPGTPADFSLSRLEGGMDMQIGAGRLLNIEAGAGRVFGLFSLHSLRRRLALDFSDVFAKGFSFDRIHGKFSLFDGDAYTNDLVVEAPSARIEISGRTGLAAQDYDQLVTVIPQVQSTLPIAGAIAGGPVVGAALLLADKLFARQLEDLTRFARRQYTVTGSWSEPQVNELPREPARGLQTEDPASANQPQQD